MRNNTKGYISLAELMIIVVIIGLLAAMAIPAFYKVRYIATEKAIKRGEQVSPERRKWFREESARLKARGQEVVDVNVKNAVENIYDGYQAIVIEGKSYYLLPKHAVLETEIAGQQYWLVPAK